MKVEVLNKHVIKDPIRGRKTNSSDDNMTPYEEMYQLSEQMIIWFRATPYREGLNDRVRAFHSLLHQVVQSEHVLVPVPVPHRKPEVHVLELDMLDDGKLYDAYDIYYDEEGKMCADIEEMKEMSLDEYESRAELNRSRLNRLLEAVEQQNKGV